MLRLVSVGSARRLPISSVSIDVVGRALGRCRACEPPIAASTATHIRVAVRDDAAAKLHLATFARLDGGLVGKAVDDRRRAGLATRGAASSCRVECRALGHEKNVSASGA